MEDAPDGRAPRVGERKEKGKGGGLGQERIKGTDQQRKFWAAGRERKERWGVGRLG